MATYRKYNWPELFQSFEQSGLTQTQFCRQHNLNPKYFSRKRTDYLAMSSLDNAVFHKIRVETPTPAADRFIIDSSIGKIHCPASLSIPQLISLIQALS